MTSGGRNDQTSVASMVEDIVGCKWSVGILQQVADGCRRPSGLLRALPGLSAKVMNERLRKMQRFGIVTRTVTGEKPPLEVEYALSPFGLRFIRIIDEVRHLQEAIDTAEKRGTRPLLKQQKTGERPCLPGKGAL